MPNDPPTKLYKYKDISGEGIDHVEDMLRNNRLWYSSPQKFNDPFDCRCLFEVEHDRNKVVRRKAEFLIKHNKATLAGAIAQAAREVPTNPEELRRFRDQQFRGHSIRAENTGILCLTTDCDNILMWTHYARNHTGICIEFRVRTENDSEHIDFFGRAFPVEYTDHMPVTNFMQDNWEDVVRKAFFTKSSWFEHEREYRRILMNEGEGLKPIPHGIVSAIILGCDIDARARERVVTACSQYDGPVKIVEATPNPETFGLNMTLAKTV